MSTKEKHLTFVSLNITKAIRKSGFLAVHSPYELETLIAFCTFADEKGRLTISGKILAQALDLSEKQAALRIKRLLNLRWQGRPLLIKESGKAFFTPNRYRLMLPDGFQFRKEGDFQEAERENSVPWNLPVVEQSEAEGEGEEGSPVPEVEVKEGLPLSAAKGSPLPEAEGKNGSLVPEAEVGHDNVVNNIYNNKTTTKTNNNKPVCVQRRSRESGPLMREAIPSIGSEANIGRQKLIELLKAKGVTEGIARELVGKYPQERIMAQLKMLPYRSAQNPAGMLIKAIKENWAPPKAYQELEEKKAIKRVEDDKKTKEQAIKRARQQKIEAIKAKMSKKELQELRERAKQKLTRVLRNVYGENNLPETLIKAEMDYIIKKEYLKGT